MKKISSNLTFLYKRLPVISWIAIALFIILKTQIGIFILLVGLSGIIIINLYFLRHFKLIINLIDEVYYDSSFIQTVSGKKKTDIPLSTIESINYSKTPFPRIEITYNQNDGSKQKLNFATYGKHKTSEIEAFMDTVKNPVQVS